MPPGVIRAATVRGRAVGVVEIDVGPVIAMPESGDTTVTQARRLLCMGDVPCATAEAFDALATAVVLFDRDLRVVHRNASADAMLAGGPTIVTVLEQGLVGLSVEDWEAEIRVVLGGGRQVRYDGAVCTLPGTLPKRVDIAISPLRDHSEGSVVGGVLTATDVTTVHSLRQQLADLERLADSGKLVARVAHELNNPLDGILRYINLALRVLDERGSAKVVDYLRESRKGLMRMVQITGDLLAYSRTNRDDTEQGNINRLVEEAVRSMQDRATDAGVVITASYRDEGMPSIRGTRLYQVCCNLIKNALDAMDSGGMLTISTGVVDAVVTLRFEDTGVGLPEDVDKVFEPFYTTKSSDEGTGLGLAICTEFVEQLGGTITAGHRPGGGAVFTVKFPVSPPVS